MRKKPDAPDVSCETFSSLLKETLQNLELSLNDKHCSKMFLFWQELLSWNKTHNLTTVLNYKEAITKHFADSLLSVAIPTINFKNKKVLDFGTGGGFPGIPLSIIFPESSFYLLDKSRKKVSFLYFLSAHSQFDNIIPVLSDIKNYFEKFDIIISRAVNLNIEILENLKKNLLPGGIIVSYTSAEQNPALIDCCFSEHHFCLSSYSRKIYCYRF
jgi:16S rRNA (guanine527-N7)-methyltransferase